MKIKFLIAFYFVLAMIKVDVIKAQEIIPEDYDSISIESNEAYKFAKSCMPSLRESTFNQLVKSATDKNTITHSPADKSKPILGISKGRVYCISMSSHKYPILPLSFFDGTIDFSEMQKEDVKILRTDLSRQLATTGIATALVMVDDETAFRIGFVFNHDNPSRVFYHGSLLKKSDFGDKDYKPVYQASGGMTISSRGQPSEHFKNTF